MVGDTSPDPDPTSDSASPEPDSPSGPDPEPEPASIVFSFLTFLSDEGIKQFAAFHVITY